MQNCICYFQIQWRNGIKKNKDRVDNQTCTMVENGQKRSHFFFLFIYQTRANHRRHKFIGKAESPQLMVELIHNSAIIGPLVNKTWGILLHTQNCGSNELASQLLESLSSLIGLQWDLEMIYYLLLAWWKWSKLCLKINHQQSSVTFTGLRWLGTGRRGLSWHKRRAQCLPDEYLIWTHLETYSQFWFCLPVMATIQRFIRDVTLHFTVFHTSSWIHTELKNFGPKGHPDTRGVLGARISGGPRSRTMPISNSGHLGSIWPPYTIGFFPIWKKSCTSSHLMWSNSLVL